MFRSWNYNFKKKQKLQGNYWYKEHYDSITHITFYKQATLQLLIKHHLTSRKKSCNQKQALTKILFQEDKPLVHCKLFKV